MLEIIQAIHTWPQALAVIAIAAAVPGTVVGFLWAAKR
jgi:hypothetical protein